MNNTWLIILGVLAAGLAVFLLLPYVLPEPEVAPEVPAAAAAEPDETEPPAAIEAEGEPGEVEPASQEPGEEEVPAAVSYAIDGTIGSTEYPNAVEIAGVKVHWANDASYLRVGLIAPGSGYAAIGFDPVRGMEEANMILGYVQDGKAYFRDDYGTEPTAHMADTDRGGTGDIVASAGAEWTDQTILEFIIPLDSGDSMDKRLVPGNAYTILVAYHDLQDGFTAQHSRRGTGEIRLDAVP